MIHQLAYRSRSGLDTSHSADEIRSILVVSRRNNAAANVTGFLLCDEAGFFQILEGAEGDVTTAFRRIEKDPRHRDIEVIQTWNRPARTFPEWSMGGASRNGDHAPIFVRHGIEAERSLADLPFPAAMALAMDLQDALRAARSGGGVGSTD